MLPQLIVGAKILNIMEYKSFYILVLLLISSLSLSAQDQYNQNQARFRNDINQFLREEGYSPSINTSTGDINFKMEGINYVVRLDTDYKGPYLVILNATFNMDPLTSSNKSKLFETENTVNSRYDCVKVRYLEYENTNLLIFSVESFCHNSDDFKYALARYLVLIKSAISDFTNIYEDTSSFASSPSRRINSPYYTTTSGNTSCKIVSIEVSTYETKVNFEYTNRYPSGGWCSIDKNTYILCDTGQKYALVKAEGIPLSPKTYNFAYQGQKLTFTLVFPAIPSSTRKFDLIESNSSTWKFYGVTI